MSTTQSCAPTYGTIKDLHVAMSDDETLLGMVQELATASAEDIFSANFRLDEKVQNLFSCFACEVKKAHHTMSMQFMVDCPSAAA